MIDPAVYWPCFGIAVLFLVVALAWPLIGTTVLGTLLVLASAALVALTIASVQPRSEPRSQAPSRYSASPVAIGGGSSKCGNHEVAAAIVHTAGAARTTPTSPLPHRPVVLLAGVPTKAESCD